MQSSQTKAIRIQQKLALLSFSKSISNESDDYSKKDIFFLSKKQNSSENESLQKNKNNPMKNNFIIADEALKQATGPGVPFQKSISIIEASLLQNMENNDNNPPKKKDLEELPFKPSNKYKGYAFSGHQPQNFESYKQEHEMGEQQ